MENEYSITSETATVGGKQMEIRNFIPRFADDKDKDNTKKRIQAELYNIFAKYMAKGHETLA